MAMEKYGVSCKGKGAHKEPKPKPPGQEKSASKEDREEKCPYCGDTLYKVD